MRLAERSDAPAERVRVVRLRRSPTLTLSRKSDRLTALRRSSPLPPGEGDRVRVHEPKRLRPLTQEAVDERGLAGAIGSARGTRVARICKRVRFGALFCDKIIMDSHGLLFRFSRLWWCDPKVDHKSFRHFFCTDIVPIKIALGDRPHSLSGS